VLFETLLVNIAAELLGKIPSVKRWNVGNGIDKVKAVWVQRWIRRRTAANGFAFEELRIVRSVIPRLSRKAFTLTGIVLGFLVPQHIQNTSMLTPVGPKQTATTFFCGKVDVAGLIVYWTAGQR
jgi:hypothetical protein